MSDSFPVPAGAGTGIRGLGETEDVDVGLGCAPPLGDSPVDEERLSPGDRHPFTEEVVIGGDLVSPDTAGEVRPDNPDKSGLGTAPHCLAICDQM